ncbi:hypothetical protein TNCV_3011881 [Trichonephila clavipes]|nr:hypothetical protein TNCV_3011881 [Trichonephila clavipes]
MKRFRVHSLCEPSCLSPASQQIQGVIVYVHVMAFFIIESLKSRSVTTIVSTVSMIQGSQATGALTHVTTVPLTGLSYLKWGPEGILIQGPLRTSYASALKTGRIPPKNVCAIRQA